MAEPSKCSIGDQAPAVTMQIQSAVSSKTVCQPVMKQVSKFTVLKDYVNIHGAGHQLAIDQSAWPCNIKHTMSGMSTAADHMMLYSAVARADHCFVQAVLYANMMQCPL